MAVDESAIAALYERYGHALYRRCLTLVDNPDDARELLQEVFLQFWRGRARFEGRSSAFTYLYRIATNLSIDRLRRRRTAGVQLEVDTAAPASASPGPDARAQASAQLVELTRGLDEETLTVAVMLYVDGMTQEEIAMALDLSRRTIGKRVKRFLSHARKRATDTGASFELETTRAHGS